MKSIVVVGGAGFIGSHTCKALARAGFQPIVLDDLSTGHAKNAKWGPLIVGNIQQAEVVEEILREYRPEAVMHFAASAYVGESSIDPQKYYLNNVAGTLSLLNAMMRAGVRSLVFSSSCAVYGAPAALPIVEDAPLQPINPYGWTKLMVEQILSDYCVPFSLSSVSLRYFNAAGADPDGELHEQHSPETHLIPRALMAAAGMVDRLEVFGGDYDTPDGTCIRDYVHVTDLAEAHVCALDFLRSNSGCWRFNVGSGTGASIRQIIAMIERLTGRLVPHIFRPRRPGDPPILVADPSEARLRLGFAPRYSDLETMIRTSWASFDPVSRGERAFVGATTAAG